MHQDGGHRCGQVLRARKLTVRFDRRQLRAPRAPGHGRQPPGGCGGERPAGAAGCQRRARERRPRRREALLGEARFAFACDASQFGRGRESGGDRDRQARGLGRRGRPPHEDFRQAGGHEQPTVRPLHVDATVARPGREAQGLGEGGSTARPAASVLAALDEAPRRR